MQKYQNMKDSGVAWLGDIPADWGISKIFAHYKRKRVKNHPTEELLSVYRDYGVIPKSSRNDNFNTESADLGNYQLVEPNDLVTNKMKTWQGSIAVSNYRGIVSPAYYIMSPTDRGRVSPRFIHYLLRSPVYISQYKRLSKGIRPGQWDLEYEQFKGLEFPLPNYKTQKRIANYLDQEIARMDQLVSKQQRLLGFLEEKRRATITHIVTRGTNHDAIIQPTNDRWVTHLPQGWSVSRLKYFTSLITDGTHTTPTYVDKGIPFLSIKDVSSGKIDFSNCKYISEDEHRILARHTRIEKGDILFTRIGTLGINVIIDIDTVFDIFVSLGLLKIIPGSINKNYLVYCMNSDYYFGYIQQVKAGGDTAAAKFNLRDVANSPIIVPTPAEQDDIVRYLDKKLAAFDRQKESITKQITLLNERRISLISHAVTGKIKV